MSLQDSVPRGIMEVSQCLSIKGAEDTINKPHAFEISTADTSMYFIADSDKVDGAMSTSDYYVSFVGFSQCLS